MRDMDEQTLGLYELYKAIVKELYEDEPNTHKVILFEPEAYIELARRNLALQREVERLKYIEVKHSHQVFVNMEMADKLREVKKRLKDKQINLGMKL